MAGARDHWTSPHLLHIVGSRHLAQFSELTRGCNGACRASAVTLSVTLRDLQRECSPLPAPPSAPLAAADLCWVSDTAVAVAIAQRGADDTAPPQPRNLCVVAPSGHASEVMLEDDEACQMAAEVDGAVVLGERAWGMLRPVPTAVQHVRVCSTCVCSGVAAICACIGSAAAGARGRAARARVWLLICHHHGMATAYMQAMLVETASSHSVSDLPCSSSMAKLPPPRSSFMPSEDALRARSAQCVPPYLPK